jgi:putative transcriptional regulator
MKSLQGQILIASHELEDPNFFRSVVLVVEHNDDGAMGVILNRPTDTPIADAWDQVFQSDCSCQGLLHQGGPCDGPLMVLHDQPLVSQVTIANHVHFSTDKDNIKWLVEHASDPLKFIVGYASWGAGQLEDELTTDSWLVVPASCERVFYNDTRQWDELTKAVGREAMYRQLNIKHIPKDPSRN